MGRLKKGARTWEKAEQRLASIKMAGGKRRVSSAKAPETVNVDPQAVNSMPEAVNAVPMMAMA